MMNKLGLKITSTGMLLASQIAAVSAQGNVSSVNVPPTLDIPAIVDRVMNWGFGFLIVIAALFLLWAAYMYLTASVFPDNMNKAKNYILYAVIAIVVAFIARGAVTIVTTLLRGTTG